MRKIDRSKSPLSIHGLVIATLLEMDKQITHYELRQLFDECFRSMEDFPIVYLRKYCPRKYEKILDEWKKNNDESKIIQKNIKTS